MIIGQNPTLHHHDNMVTIQTIRGPLPNRTAREAACPTTTDAPSGIRHWITKTAITRALTGDPDREVDTRATEVIEAREVTATAEAAEVREVKKANKRKSDTNKTTQHRPEEAGEAARIDRSDSWR